MKNYKRAFIRCLIAVPIFYLLLFFAAKYYYNANTDGPTVGPNMRFEAINILRNCQFDSIILGTSILENTSAKEASALIGGEFVNISLSGSDFFERSIVLKKALQAPIKRVIYSLDSCYIDCPIGQSDSSLKEWRKLYEQTMDIHSLFTNINPKRYKQYDTDRPNAWLNQPYNMNRFGGLDKWVNNIDKQGIKPFLTIELPKQAQLAKNKSGQIQADPENEAIMLHYIDDNLLNFVRGNPATEFHLIFPPYYKYTYAVMRQNDSKKFYLHQQAIKYITTCATTLPNLFVYGFENQKFSADIANYKDVTHYSPEINSLFLQSIAQKQHLLTKENVDAYMRECEAQAYNFDLSMLAAEAQKLIDAANSKSP